MRVPLHGRRVRGWVMVVDVAVPEASELRDVIELVSAGPPAEVVDLCRWAAWRWAGPLATFLRAASPPNVVRDSPERATAVYPGAAPTGAELRVVGPRDVPTVTLAPEGSTLVLDPSAARAAELVGRLRDDGREVVALGSEHPDAVRTREWDRARAGACVVVGGRSAVWAPVPDLAAVVVIDEGDEALEDERAPTWNARDVALERAGSVGASVRMVTPAPTVDAIVAVGEPTSVAGRWPPVEVVDQRDEEPGHGLLSAALADALRHAVGRDARAVCVLNRRGRARLLACRSCGELATCERCGATVEHREQELACAQCATVRPLVCLHCHGSTFRAVRPGIAHLRDDLAALLPRTDVGAVDAATDDVPDAPVLVGTEAVLHRVTGPVGLVAYLELDQELLAPRARAAEQALWLLVRGARLLGDGGRLLLQTRLPEHEVVRGGTPRRADGRRRGRAGPPPDPRVPALRRPRRGQRRAGSGRGRLCRGRRGWRDDPRSGRCRRRGAGAPARPDGRRPVRRPRRAGRRRRPCPRAAPDRRGPPSRVRPAGSLGACTRCDSSAIPC